jgi:hypothetical protein
MRGEAERLISQIITTHGLTIQIPQATFTYGSQSSYSAELTPILVSALEARGYLPYRASSPWSQTWSHAPYQLKLEVIERLEGSYLSTQNRLTRIEVKVSLASHGEVLWRINPTVRSSESLPELSTFVASRVASGSTRSEEIEKLLYQNARGQIEERLKRNLGNMPVCARTASP